MSANRLKSNSDKTEPISAPSIRGMQVSFICGSMQTSYYQKSTCSIVRLLKVIISADLDPEKYVSNVIATCVYHPSPSVSTHGHIRRPLSTESATTLVHAFVMSRVDYCNVVFAAAPKSVTDKLQRSSLALRDRARQIQTMMCRCQSSALIMFLLIGTHQWFSEPAIQLH